MCVLRYSILMKRVYNNMDNTEDIATKVALVERNTQPQGIRLNDPAAVAKSLQQDLVALATEIQRADSLLKADARSKLHVIVEQIKSLKKQAEDILIEADWNVKLHHVACNFVKHPGHIYHLYERQTGQLYFSMLSPEEWGSSGPGQIHKGSYRLEQDQSWTPLEEIDIKNKDMAMMANVWSTIPNIITSPKSIDLDLNT